MKRLDWLELEDRPGFPGWLRDPMTAYLKVVIDLTGPYDVCAPEIAGVLRATGLRGILDLASGGGGPWPGLREAIVREGVEPEVRLTDLHPNASARERLAGCEGVTYDATPQSALEAPSSPPRMRTIFTGLHHFDPDAVRHMMKSAQTARVPFLAAEATHRSLRGAVLSIFIPLLVLVLMPRVRPLRVSTLLLTYVVPVLPLLIWWDGLLSTLRTYRVEELRSFAEEIGTDDYTWRADELDAKGAPIPVTRLLGTPAPPG
jgi:hypothetical protein